MVHHSTNAGSVGDQSHKGVETAAIDISLWRQLTEAGTDEEFCHSWLGIQSHMVGGVYGSVVVLSLSEREVFAPVAFWPMGFKYRRRLTGITERVLKERKGVVVKSEYGGNGSSSGKELFHIAFPVRIFDKLYGVVSLEIEARPHDQLQSAMRQLQWGIAWLEKWILCKGSGENSRVNERLATAMDLTAIALQDDRFQASTTSFVTVIATRLDCERVSIGFRNGKHIKVQSLSHSARFKKQMNLIRSIGAAMDESVDQQKVLVYPVSSEEDNVDVLYAHESLAKDHGYGAICTIPFVDKDGMSYGALTLERSLDIPFNPDDVMLCDSITALVAPILEEKRKNDRALIRKAGDSLRKSLEKLFGSGHMVLKLIYTLIGILAVFFVLAKGEYRVTAKSTIEGKVQRAIVAPYDGYIYMANVRAGDPVKEGQVMSSLDDRDMRLERLKWESKRGQFLRQYREAMSKGQRSEMKVLNEQIGQANVQIDILDEQLLHAKLLSPFDGVVVSGDLSQSLGAPVERGQLLFEVAPLHEYRVKLNVNEREIEQINVGQTGEMVLNSLPKIHFPITVEKITPVSTVEEGANYFLVEAGLDNVSERLRPGMEGFGKISVARCRLIWIWTHDIFEWLRLWMWSWWP